MTTALLQLEDHLTRLTLAPDLGGAIANWQLLDGRPLLRHADAEALAAGTPRRLGCYPLAPWSNRIGNGGFALPDGWLALEPNSPDPYPIHGSAWQQPWDLLEQRDSLVRLGLESRQPFAYRAEQRFQLQAGQLDIRLRVTHQDPRATWYGLGLHPYFPRSANTRLLAAADSAWLCGADKLPTERVALPAGWDFSTAAALPDGLVDNGFAGWPGRCGILQTDLGYRLDCSASGCDSFLLFCPEGQGFFCFEPVTHPVNAHHLPGRPGLRLLAAGESLEIGWSMAVSLL
ncbi:aldose 1-epimerase [Metapseudomonas resinovorans]|uniref:Putative aldose 1-epimerase n=1 Tax=Metapseudomonas resinovorans NBRC 106553 TaxID=1245471 RepID=S6BBA8_METRE|nr:aldose 1-epimerase [Pseudomonas resinovorans]BAN46354.1 putative aldose 1-epimerase [Pseudomonas resinovorans NBRC 106553]